MAAIPRVPLRRRRHPSSNPGLLSRNAPMDSARRTPLLLLEQPSPLSLGSYPAPSGRVLPRSASSPHPALGRSTSRLVLVFLFILCDSPILALCRMQEG